MARCAPRRGSLSLHFVNVTDQRPAVAPWRGRDGRFGTNPVCIALPGPAPDRPIIADMATSRIAMGKVRVARNKGEQIAAETLLDDDGEPTTDPHVMYRRPRGALLTFGEHKGYALAFICEMLAGAVTGSGTMRPERQDAESVTNGMLTIVIDPARIADQAWMADEIAAMADYITASPPRRPDEPVLIPGDPERAQPRRAPRATACRSTTRPGARSSPRRAASTCWPEGVTPIGRRRARRSRTVNSLRRCRETPQRTENFRASLIAALPLSQCTCYPRLLAPPPRRLGARFGGRRLRPRGGELGRRGSWRRSGRDRRRRNPGIRACAPCRHSGRAGSASDGRRACTRRACTSSSPVSTSSGVLPGARPVRLATRKICVSTAIVGSPKATLSTTFAVLRPTPGSASSASRSRGTSPPCCSTSIRRQRDHVLRLGAEEADRADQSRRAAPRRAPSIFCGVSATANSAGVALLTPTSVACADSTTATSRVNGLMNSSSVCGIGRVSASRR